MKTVRLLEESVRLLFMRLLVPVSRFLPKKWALRCADGLSLLLAISPVTGLNAYWSMRCAYGYGRLVSFKTAWDGFRRGYRDFVIARRVIEKREDPFGWQIVEKNSGPLDSLRRSGRSYIVATGHFSMRTSYAMYSPNVTTGHVVRVSLPVASPVSNAHTRRVDYQFGTCLSAMPICWGGDAEVVFVGSDPRGAKSILDRLCQPGNVVFIDIDAVWKAHAAGSYERPFAGHSRRTFSTGAVRLARMARCPIVTCIRYMDGNGAIVLEWGEPLYVNDEVDTQLMDRLLDRIEIGIGERPGEYALNIGIERCWDSERKQWKATTPLSSRDAQII